MAINSIGSTPRSNTLLNIDLCDLFFIKEDCDIANYADGNTPYLSGNNTEEVLNGLENVPSNLFQWFTENELKVM